VAATDVLTEAGAGAGAGPEQLLLDSLRATVAAAVVEVVALPDADGTLAETLAATPDVSPVELRRVRAFALRHLRTPNHAGEHDVWFEQLGWRIWLSDVRGADGAVAGGLVVARPGDQDWTAEEQGAIRGFQRLVALTLTAGGQAQEARRRRTLDELVTNVAVHLMSASHATADETVLWVLQALVDFFAVDTAYLRRNDHEAGLSILVDEWPRRQDVPDPDPIGVVPFEGADPVFVASRDLREPFVIRPDTSPTEYLERIEDASGVPQISMAMVPLVHDDRTEGVLGFVNFGDRPWEVDEINALQAIASLLMQLNARIDAEERLHHNAFHDELTGLPNRRALFEELERRLHEPGPASVAAVFIDLDQFKGMNDVLGHGAGDRVLSAIAERLRGMMSGEDVAARFGGDEFVVILRRPSGSRDALELAERLREAIAKPVDLSGQRVNRTASIGIAVTEARSLAADELLARADAALYAAKERGRNRIVVFDDDLRAQVDDRYNLEIALRGAIDDGQLRVFYQPEVNLRTGRLEGFEALIRWEHPVRGLLPANAFIALAEDTGLIVDLGQWVLEESCRQLAAWRAQHPGLEMTVRVNVSPAQLLVRNLVGVVTDALDRHALPGEHVSLEITEYAVMQDVDRSVGILRDLRALGIDVAIDDFGTGHSSMAQLKRLPVSTLKIDQSFVRGLGSNPGDRSIVESIVQLARAFGLGIVAEGVESDVHARTLLKLGCTRAQGFYFSPPIPPDECEDLLAREMGLHGRARVALDAWAPLRAS
jgi:diguanylate cyclase (GGDEF)-like protein